MHADPYFSPPMPEDARPGERRWLHPQSGPVLLEASTHGSDIDVTFVPTSRAELTLYTDAAEGPARAAVDGAHVVTTPGRMTLDLDDQRTGVTIAGNNINIAGNASSIVVDNGAVYINGRLVSDSHSGSSGGRITVRAVLPEGSSIDVRSSSGSITTWGPGNEVRATASSGSIKVERARSADLEASSGSITLGSADAVQARTSSGSIRIGLAESVTARASSGSIKVIEVKGSAELTASSGSIDVGYSGTVQPRVRTSSGSRRIHRITADTPAPADRSPA